MDKLLIKEVIAPLSIAIIGFLIYYICKRTINRVFERRAKRYKNNRYRTLASLARNAIKYFILIVCGVMILDVFGIDTKSIITSLGVVGVVAGLSFQDFLKDFIAGVTIVIENQFAIGDIVEIGGFKGAVTAFTLKTTRIKAWTGEEKIIGNHSISEVINFTHNNSLAIVDIGVAYESNLKEVEATLNKLCDKLSKSLDNLKGPVQLLGIENLADSSIVYRIVAETKSGEHFAIQRKIRSEIKSIFDENNISIPYNQLVIHNED